MISKPFPIKTSQVNYMCIICANTKNSDVKPALLLTYILFLKRKTT